MSFLSAVRRLAGRKGGLKESVNKEQNLVPKRIYNLTSPATLLDSLEEDDRKRMEILFKSVKANAVPFNDGNTNVRGQLICLQKLEAKKRLYRLDFPAEVESRAEQFLNDFISKGMKEPR